MNKEDHKTKLEPETQNKLFSALQELMKEAAAELSPEALAFIREMANFRSSIIEETDRGAVLMSAAYLDDKLKMLIEGRLVEDKKACRRAFEFNGPLGTFSSRIDFSYLMGIIPKNAQKDLHTIRAIRNHFAHHAAPLRYDDEKVKALCDRLIFHGVKDAASAGSKFRRSVMGLLIYIMESIENGRHIKAASDYEIPDRTDAYKVVSAIYSKVTGDEYPLKHEHE